MNDSEDGPASVSDRQDELVVSVARQALTLWQHFPIEEPRPILLLNGPVQICQEFNTGGAKRSLRYGLMDADEYVALEPLQTIRSNSSDKTNQHMPMEPLQVQRATLSATHFETDRGPKVSSRMEGGGSRRGGRDMGVGSRDY